MLARNLTLLATVFCISVATANSGVEFEQPSSSLNKRAYQELQQGHYDLAYQISSQALTQSKIENNKIEQARALSNLASNLYYLGDKEKSLLLYSESLQISTIANDLFGINRVLNNTANIYLDLNDYDETLKYRKLQLENSLLSKDINDQVGAYVGLSIVYSRQKRFNEASNAAAQARKLLEIEPDKFTEIYLLMAEATIDGLQQQYSRPIELLKEANKIAVDNNFEGLIISTNANLVDYYLREKKYSQAISEGLQSLKAAKKARHQDKILQLHQHLSEAYEAKGNFREALHHFQRVNALNKEIAGEKVRVISEVTKIDRQMAEKDEQLIKMTKDQEILSLMLDRQKQNQIIWIALFSVVFMLVFFIYYRRSSERELQRQKKLNRQLEELDVVKDRVLTNTSHELRTPLNGIIGLSDIIIQDEESQVSESTLNSLRLIKSSGIQLAEVINDILELSKLKSSKLTIVNSEFDLQELLNDVVAVCEPQAGSSNLEIINVKSPSSTIVLQDRGRMQQILFNIIGNAVKFTKEGVITISTKIEDDEIRVFVKDTGIGIPEDKQERIFEGFEQVDSSNTREKSGSGLGLAISRGIAEALGGEITLESKLGVGTTVQLRVPDNSSHSSK